MGRLSALFVAFAMAMAGLAGAFDAGAYLYDGETSSMVTTSDFTYSGTDYTLIKINNIDTFLLTGDKPITDAAAIGNVLRGYSASTLAPSADEWAKLKAHFLDFNKSRNYQTRFGPAEKICMNAIFAEVYPCDTVASCTQTSTMICAVDPSVLCPPPEIMAQPILAYNLDVKTFNAEIGKLLALHSKFTADNSAATFKQMQDSIAKLKTAAASISKNALRFPDSASDACGDCIGRCPAVHLDTGALDLASKEITAFGARMEPLDSAPATATQIAQATSDRMNFKTNSAVVAQWAPKWKAFKAKYEKLRADSSALVPYVGDTSFTSAYSAFNAKWSEMDRKLATRDVAGIDSTFSAVSAAALSLNTTIKDAGKPYNATAHAQDTVSDLLTQARWRVNPNAKESVSGYNSLAARKNSLDSQFKPPMSAQKYISLESNYSKLANDVRAFISSQNKVTDSVADVGGQFGTISINGVFSLAAAFTPLSYSARAAVAPLIPPVVLLLTDLAIVSVAVVLFVGVLLYFKQLFRSRTLLGLWMVGLFAFLFALGVGSIAIFAFVNSSAGSGTFDEFLSSLSRSQVSYVAIDQSGANAPTVAAMTGCANTIKQQTTGLFGKSSQAFTFSGKACSWLSGNNTSAMQIDSCFDKTVGYPLFVMHMANKSADPKFSTVYNTQVELFGDEAYYKRCEIGDVLG